MDLPKFLMADDGGDRLFVVHCHSPRLIIEFIGGHGQPHFLESESDFIANELANGREPARMLARLMREAGAFYLEQTSD